MQKMDKRDNLLPIKPDIAQELKSDNTNCQYQE